MQNERGNRVERHGNVEIKFPKASVRWGTENKAKRQPEQLG